MTDAIEPKAPLPEQFYLKRLELTCYAGSDIPVAMSDLWHWCAKNLKWGESVTVQCNGIKITMEATK